MEPGESPRPCYLRTEDAIPEFVPAPPGRPIAGSAISLAPGQKSIPHRRQTDACGANRIRAQRMPSTWANWRIPVREPGRTGHHAELPVDGCLHHLRWTSGNGGGGGGKLLLHFQPESPARVRELASSVVRDSRLLLRVPGPHDRRKRINQEIISHETQVGAALSADRTLPAGVETEFTMGEESCRRANQRLPRESRAPFPSHICHIELYQRKTRSARKVFQRLAPPTSVSIFNGMNSG